MSAIAQFQMVAQMNDLNVELENHDETKRNVSLCDLTVQSTLTSLFGNVFLLSGHCFTDLQLLFPVTPIICRKKCGNFSICCASEKKIYCDCCYVPMLVAKVDGNCYDTNTNTNIKRAKGRHSKQTKLLD